MASDVVEDISIPRFCLPNILLQWMWRDENCPQLWFACRPTWSFKTAVSPFKSCRFSSEKLGGNWCVDGPCLQVWCVHAYSWGKAPRIFTYSWRKWNTLIPRWKEGIFDALQDITGTCTKNAFLSPESFKKHEVKELSILYAFFVCIFCDYKSS